MQETGFLGTAAPRAADITLLLELGMGAGLLGGAWLALAGMWRLAKKRVKEAAREAGRE